MAIKSVGREALQQVHKARQNVEEFISKKAGDLAFGAWAGAVVGFMFAPVTLGTSVPLCTTVFAVDALLNGTDYRR